MTSPKLRTAARKLVIANRRAEMQFAAALRATVAGIVRLYAKRLSAAVGATGRDDGKNARPPSGKASPEWRVEVAKLEKSTLPQIAPIVEALHAKMAKQIVKNHAEIMGTVLGLPVNSQTTRVKAAVASSRNAAIEYVEKAHRAYADQVRAVFGSGEADGLRVEVLRDRLLERGDVSESRAELIARDQTLKLAGAINEARQKDAGLTYFVWSTSNDERVRPEHAALDNQVFDWSALPEPGAPGQDFQCRCVAIPYVPELEGI